MELLWGGSVVSGATVTRFFAIHYALPIALLGTIGLHLWQLHVVNSSGELTVLADGRDRQGFYPILLSRDFGA